VRAIAGGEERQFTTDGSGDWGYGLANIGCCSQVTVTRNRTELRPILSWSPDSKRLVTTKFDQRNVRLMHLLETKNPGPVLHSYRYALPGDSVIPRFDLHVFDVTSGKGVKIGWPTMDAVNTTCCWFTTDTVLKDVKWNRRAPAVLHGSRATMNPRGERRSLVASARAILKESADLRETGPFSGGVPNSACSPAATRWWWSSATGQFWSSRDRCVKHRITSGDRLVAAVDRRDMRWATSGIGREPSATFSPPVSRQTRWVGGAAPDPRGRGP
jgi:hypothetical protein